MQQLTMPLMSLPTLNTSKWKKLQEFPFIFHFCWAAAGFTTEKCKQLWESRIWDELNIRKMKCWFFSLVMIVMDMWPKSCLIFIMQKCCEFFNFFFISRHVGLSRVQSCFSIVNFKNSFSHSPNKSWRFSSTCDSQLSSARPSWSLTQVYGESAA